MFIRNPSFIFFVFMVWERFSSAVFFDTVSSSSILRKERDDSKTLPTSLLLNVLALLLPSLNQLCLLEADVSATVK